VLTVYGIETAFATNV